MIFYPPKRPPVFVSSSKSPRISFLYLPRITLHKNQHSPIAQSTGKNPSFQDPPDLFLVTFISNEPIVSEHIFLPPKLAFPWSSLLLLSYQISSIFMPSITFFKTSVIPSHEHPLHPFPLTPPTWKDHSPVWREPTVICVSRTRS